MNNLGLTAPSYNDSLNSKISEYYNRNVVVFKLAMSYIFNNLVKNTDFYLYEQDKIDMSSTFSTTREFPSLYKQSEEDSEKELKSNIIEFIHSIKGRNLVLYDLGDKRYSLEVLNGIQGKTTNLLKSIYDELKIYDPKIDPLPTLPSSAVDLEK